MKIELIDINSLYFMLFIRKKDIKIYEFNLIVLCNIQRNI
jgi:hypothetical protein